MDNANKALIMAGSTLIAVMLLTLFVVFIRNISAWPEAQDEMLNTEQVAAFNAEYEVYQKSAMYGVDVISCLNKAYSNNDDNTESTDFFSGDGGISSRYKVNVIITIKKALEESISVSAIQYMGAPEDYTGSNYKEKAIYTDEKIRPNLKLNEVFKIDETKQVTSFSGNQYLEYNMEIDESNSKMKPGTYELLDDSADNKLEKLIAHSTETKQIVKNPNDNYVYNPTNLYGWTTATWETCLYKFKQKRFKCTGIEYSNKTGRITEIKFEEI